MSHDEIILDRSDEKSTTVAKLLYTPVGIRSQ